MNELLKQLIEALKRFVASLQNKTVEPIIPIDEVLPPPAQSQYVWTDPVSARHAVRQLCDAMGLPVALKNDLCACVAVESNFNPKAVHYNKDVNGKIWSADWGIVQVNDYFHIGKGKDFPSVDYVLNNPENCVRWMAKLFLENKQSMWSSYSTGEYKKYL